MPVFDATAGVFSGVDDPSGAAVENGDTNEVTDRRRVAAARNLKQPSRPSSDNAADVMRAEQLALRARRDPSSSLGRLLGGGCHAVDVHAV